MARTKSPFRYYIRFLFFVWQYFIKLAKLRRHASRVHFSSNSFGQKHFVLELFRFYTLGFEHVDRHVGHYVRLHVGHHVSHHVGHHVVVSTLCEVSEMLTKWKSESITYRPTDRRTGVGARDTCVSKNWLRGIFSQSTRKGLLTAVYLCTQCINSHTMCHFTHSVYFTQIV